MLDLALLLKTKRDEHWHGRLKSRSCYRVDCRLDPCAIVREGDDAEEAVEMTVEGALEWPICKLVILKKRKLRVSLKFKLRCNPGLAFPGCSFENRMQVTLPS